MLDVWDRGGLKQYRSPDSPRARVLNALDEQGFISVVAVTSELEFVRYVRPGETLQNVELLEDVSAEKQTGLGVGHFMTTRHRYTNSEGDHVGDLLLRVLKIKPGTGRTAAPAEGARKAPDPDPALRPRPAVNRDNQFFWDGARQHELRIQRCEKCAMLHSPPIPRCAGCGSFDMGYTVASGRGTLYSFAAPHYPQANGFRYPVLVGLVELEEGTRVVANLVGVALDQVSVGLPLELTWLDSHPAIVEGATDSRGPISLPQFRPARAARRAETLAVTDVQVGDALPLMALPVTPTLVVSGAIATRDYQVVHHDRDLAHARGSADIFVNINTSLGHLERYVGDWAGPEAVFRALRVRLGAPAYPYDTLSFSGRVESVDAATGAVTVAVRASNSRGDHISGTAELTLPGAR